MGGVRAVALSVEVLRALSAPVTLEALARTLDVPPPHLRRELEALERRGYVRRLACVVSACGWCALKATCVPTEGERWLRA